MNSTETREQFENAAYSGYVSRGIGDTDGWYHPIDRTAFVDAMRLRVPVGPADFGNDTEFAPTEQECSEYNQTFTERPKVLRIAVKLAKGWKTLEMNGTKDAHEFLGWVAEWCGFEEARLEDYAMAGNGYWVPIRVQIQGCFVPNNKAITNRKLLRRGDFLGIYAGLLQYSETHEL
jgi:hypothetical protein